MYDFGDVVVFINKFNVNLKYAGLVDLAHGIHILLKGSHPVFFKEILYFFQETGGP